MKTSRTCGNAQTADTLRERLEAARTLLGDLHQHLEALEDRISGAFYDDETDAPRNLAGELASGIRSVLEESLQPAAAALERLETLDGLDDEL